MLHYLLYRVTFYNTVFTKCRKLLLDISKFNQAVFKWLPKDKLYEYYCKRMLNLLVEVTTNRANRIDIGPTNHI